MVRLQGDLVLQKRDTNFSLKVTKFCTQCPGQVVGFLGKRRDNFCL